MFSFHEGFSTNLDKGHYLLHTSSHKPPPPLQKPRKTILSNNQSPQGRKDYGLPSKDNIPYDRTHQNVDLKRDLPKGILNYKPL